MDVIDVRRTLISQDLVRLSCPLSMFFVEVHVHAPGQIEIAIDLFFRNGRFHCGDMGDLKSRKLNCSLDPMSFKAQCNRFVDIGPQMSTLVIITSDLRSKCAFGMTHHFVRLLQSISVVPREV